MMEQQNRIDEAFHKYCEQNAQIFERASRPKYCRKSNLAYKISIPQVLVNRKFQIFHNAGYADAHGEGAVVVMVQIPDEMTAQAKEIEELKAKIKELEDAARGEGAE